MHKITPHLWYNEEAKEAAEFYASLFKNSKITNTTTLHNTPSGDTESVSFELARQPFMAISAGPLFKFNPSISFHVKCQTEDEINFVWEKLARGGQVLMPLGKYPFSDMYGWLQDKYGLSWQIIFAPGSDMKQKITPIFMFVGKVLGRAEEAVNFYAAVFHNAKIENILRYEKGEEPAQAGTVKYCDFKLGGMEFGAMDSAGEHNFAFNEAISFIVYCDTQGEIDYYWGKLSADPQAEQCGWLKDKFGVSWQIVPTVMEEMMNSKDDKKIARVTEVFLKMKKFDIAQLMDAYKKE